MNDESKVSLARVETILGISWFLLDGGWLMGWRFLSYPFIAFAIAAAIARFIWLEEGRVALLVASAECAWLAMNAFWVIGDFEKIAWCITVAKICLVAGLILLGASFAVSREEIRERLFRPLRRLRLMLQS